MIGLTKNAAVNRKQVAHARIAVLGAARSGRAVAKLLAEEGARVLLSDIQPRDQLNLQPDDLKESGIELEGGGHSRKILESDLICISPGLPLSLPILQRAQQQKIPVVGELEISSWFCQAPIYAITGSNGKTTTTTLTGAILRSQKPDTIVAGNIGEPLAEFVRNSSPREVAVLEVSSFQLETIVSFHPAVAVIMNLTANHLDRYPDFEAYAQAKLNILQNMRQGDILILNKDDRYLITRLGKVKPRILYFSLQRHAEPGAYWENDHIQVNLNSRTFGIKLNHYYLRGPHNRYNMMAAALLALLQGIPETVIASHISAFPGVEHRLEFVREFRGVTFVNDSKATTVDSLACALQSYPGNIILIAGGKDKGGNFSEVNSLLEERVKTVVLIGQAANRMDGSWHRVARTIHAKSLEEAVRQAFRQAEGGDVVLLSPACSSFDMFRDYEDRGKQFKKIVMEMN